MKRIYKDMIEENWQPIESAPKDDTDVLLGTAGAPAIWTGYYRQPSTERHGRTFWPEGWTRDGYYDVGWVPTHWMPLPEPPVSK